MLKRKFIPAVLFFLLATVGCNRNATHLLPKELVGFWTADEPRYKGRFLELYRAYVILGTGAGEVPQVQIVDSVEADPDGDHVAYKIASTDLNGVQYNMTLLYKPAGEGVILFKHQENILWKRHKENEEAPKADAKTPSKITPAQAQKAAH
jgi:hypothetical protein